MIWAHSASTLVQVLVTHRQATYFLRARGHSVNDAGIFDNDILVVDRAVKARYNYVVVAMVDSDLMAQIAQHGPPTPAHRAKMANPLFVKSKPHEILNQPGKSHIAKPGQ